MDQPLGSGGNDAAQAMDPRTLRPVTHVDVTAEQVRRAAEALRRAL